MRALLRSSLVFASLVAFGCGSSNTDTNPLPTDGGADTSNGDAAKDSSSDETATDSATTSDSTTTDSATGDAPGDTSEGGAGLAKVGHVVVIYLENHSFDNLYGELAGAENLASAGGKVAQIDPSTGAAYATLPQVSAVTSAGVPDLPNQPWAIEDYIAADKDTPVDLVHRYYQEQMQIDGGKMDMFVAVSDAKGLSFGYYHTAGLPLANEAKTKGVICDHFFHSAFGGSFLNHQWLIAAATPKWDAAPTAIRAVLDSSGKMTTDGAVTPDGYLINTIFTANTPHPSTVPSANLVPSIDDAVTPTIGDRLDAKGVDWAWYSGGWDDAVAGTIDPALNFQFHHQPFAYYKNYADGTPGRTAHLKDEKDFVAALSSGTLPPVSFVKPVGIDNEHPKYADVLTGENHTLDLLNKIRASAVWKDTVVIVTYDEHGGFYDHVAPPAGDKWGPGSRVPTLIFSPWAKAGTIDATTYETVSILALIEHRWGLTALGTRDAAAKDLAGTLDFSKSP